MATIHHSLPYPANLYFYRLTRTFHRWRRAFHYASGHLREDDAQDIMLDCFEPAGWHPLTILSTGDTLTRAREIFADNPALPHLAASACARVRQKWENNSDELSQAEDWAIDLMEDYARQLNIALIKWEDVTPPEISGAAVSSTIDGS